MQEVCGIPFFRDNGGFFGEPKTGASTACIYLISGSFSLPYLGSFHLSLTVLVRYQSLNNI